MKHRLEDIKEKEIEIVSENGSPVNQKKQKLNTKVTLWN